MSDMVHSSDEFYDIFCEQCNLHGTYANADGFCVNCSEYMCKMCLMYHNRYMPEHTQQDARHMPTDFCAEKCSTHPRLLIKFYCQTCEEFACNECKTESHKNCDNIGHISSFVTRDTVTENIEDVKEYMNYLHVKLKESQRKVDFNTEMISLQEIDAKKTMYMHREKMKKTLQDMKQEIVEAYNQEIQDAEEILRELRQKREETIAQFNEKEAILEKNLKVAENNMEEKIEQTKDADLTKLSGIEQKHRDIASDLEKMSLVIESKQKSSERCSTFIAVKTSQKALENFEEDIKQMTTSSDTSEFKVSPEANGFTFDTVETTTKFFSYKEIVKPIHKSKSAVRLSELQIKPVIYTSLCLLNDNQLLVTDNKNCSIYVIEDLLENKILSALHMPSAPWGIAKVTDNEVVVTFPEPGIVKFLTFSETMTVTKTQDVKVGYECYGVTYGRNRLIVSYLDPARVQILDMSGNVLKCFDEHVGQGIRLSSPKHLAVSPNKRFIYISDCNENIVASMTFDGKLKALYKDDQLAAPFQLTVDGEGLVYICGRGSNNVHQLSADLTRIKLLVDEKQKLLKPVSVAVCENVKRLYIGAFNSNVIEVFQLTLE